MDPETLRLLIVYGVLPIVIGTGAFFVRTIHNRIEELEKQIPDKITEKEARQLLADKIEPIREDIHDLKSKLDKIIEFLMNK